MSSLAESSVSRPDRVGPWLLVQSLELLDQSTLAKFPLAVVETVTAHDVECDDIHPAVEDRGALLAHTPGLKDDALILETFAEMIARRLKLCDQQAIRVAVYPDLLAAHEAAGDGKPAQA